MATDQGPNTHTEQASGSENRQPKAPNATPQEQLPTERIAFDKQLKLLLAYAHGSDNGKTPVNNEEVGRIVEMNSSTVSLANAFFVKLGFLNRVGREFVPSSEVIEFATANQWDEQGAPTKLAPIIERSWFWQAVRPKLLMRSVTEKELIADIAQRAMVGTSHKPQLRMLISYLVSCGMIRRDGDQFTLNRAAVDKPASPTQETPAQKLDTPATATGKPAPSTLDQMYHPLIFGLLDKLPREGAEWSTPDREKWLAAARSVFDLLYEEGSDIPF